MDWQKIKEVMGPRVVAISRYLLLVLLVMVAATYIAALFGLKPEQVPVADPATIQQIEELKKRLADLAEERARPVAEAIEQAMGWVNDPDEVAIVRETLPVKVFSDTPAGKSADDMPPFVFGWKAYETLLGEAAPIKNQGGVGSCVSFGTNTAAERTLANEIIRRKGGRSEFTRYVEEATYGGSRVEIGGGRIRGDGSVGAWAAQFITKYGLVPRKKYPNRDLTTYNETLCRDWGQRGVPDEFEQIARQFPVKSFVQVKTFEEAKKAAAQGYFTAICSNQGFTKTRNGSGVAQPSGSWAHCMCFDGYYTDENNRQFGHITNSWARYFHGPNGWGNPQEDGFWAEAAVIDRMLRQGDSWAFSGVTGFPARKPINWDVRRRTIPLNFARVFVEHSLAF